MACLISKDGKTVICGVPLREDYHLDGKRRVILQQGSLWYEPILIAKRKKFERIDLFIARFVKKKGFRPVAFSTWWKKVALPQLKPLTPEGKENRGS